MKFLFVLLIVASCGKYETDSDSQRIGQNMSIEQETMSKTEIEDRDRICDALRSKTTKIPLMTNSVFNFTVEERSCDGNEKSETVNVMIETRGVDYSFIKSNGNYFVFKDVETTKSGFFKAYCEATHFPVMFGDIPVKVSTLNNTTCSSNQSNSCITLSFGLKNENTGDYTVSMIESLSIDTNRNSNRYGFYTSKTAESSVSCNGPTSLIKATLN